MKNISQNNNWLLAHDDSNSYASIIPPQISSVIIESLLIVPQDASTTTAAPAPAPASTRQLPASQPAAAPATANSRFLPPGLFQVTHCILIGQCNVFWSLIGKYFWLVNCSLFQAPVTNQNQGLQNTLAAGGLGAVGAVAASGCLFGGNCDLSFRPSLGAAVDANGQVNTLFWLVDTYTTLLWLVRLFPSSEWPLRLVMDRVWGQPSLLELNWTAVVTMVSEDSWLEESTMVTPTLWVQVCRLGLGSVVREVRPWPQLSSEAMFRLLSWPESTSTDQTMHLVFR